MILSNFNTGKNVKCSFQLTNHDTYARARAHTHTHTHTDLIISDDKQQTNNQTIHFFLPEQNFPKIGK